MLAREMSGGCSVGPSGTDAEEGARPDAKVSGAGAHLAVGWLRMHGLSARAASG
jgi:hypothetical protein